MPVLLIEERARYRGAVAVRISSCVCERWLGIIRWTLFQPEYQPSAVGRYRCIGLSKMCKGVW